MTTFADARFLDADGVTRLAGALEIAGAINLTIIGVLTVEDATGTHIVLVANPTTGEVTVGDPTIGHNTNSLTVYDGAGAPIANIGLAAFGVGGPVGPCFSAGSAFLVDSIAGGFVTYIGFNGSTLEIGNSSGQVACRIVNANGDTHALEVVDDNGNPIFQVDNDGSLHGLTGKSLTFDL